MKRLRPRPVLKDEPRYPSLVELALPESVPRSRRAFLRGAAAAGAAVAGSLLPSALGRGHGADRARAASARPRVQKVDLWFQKRYVFRHGNYEIQKVVAQTGDGPLTQFLKDPKMKQGVEEALRKELDLHSCVDLLNGTRLARLQARLGTVLVHHYRKMSRRTVPAPTVVLFVGVPNDRCRGDCPSVTPVCRPPRP